MSWTDRNRAVQGYCMSAEESHALRWGLRFSTGLCLGLVATDLALQSAVLILALVPVGAVAVWTRRHPFDTLSAISAVPRSCPPTQRSAVTNFCVPSTLLGIWWRRRGTATPATQPS